MTEQRRLTFVAYGVGRPVDVLRLCPSSTESRASDWHFRRCHGRSTALAPLAVLV